MGASRLGRLDLAIFLVSSAVLLSELLLTRIFSVTMFFHLSFLVVSLAMLGFGASGLLVSLLPRRFPAERLGGQAALSALLLPSAACSPWASPSSCGSRSRTR